MGLHALFTHLGTLIECGHGNVIYTRWTVIHVAMDISFTHVGQSSNVAMEVSLTQVRTVIKRGHGVGIIPRDDEETVGEGGQGGVTAGGCSETANHLLTRGLAHRHAGVSHRDRG